ncbi:MAG: PAS domain S-box protein [Acidobacteria bacterium]|nr:PAS domain S-box protein [Acidobacteriota bacterium]
MQNEELRRVQAELDVARARYFDLYDLAPVGYCTLSEQGLILEANLTAAALLGVARGALVKQRITRFILKEDQDIYYLQRKQLFETSAPQAYELRMLKKDGTVFWGHVAATATQDADGAPVCRVVLSDITARKQAEDELHQRETRFKEMFDDAPVGYHELDAEGRMTRVNRTELATLGYSAEEMLGRHVWEFVDEKDLSRKAVLEKLAGTLPPGRNIERTYWKKDGTRIPVLVQDRLLRDQDGTITGIRTTAQDITEHKRAEEEKAKLENQLQQSQKMESVGRLAGGVAHDFNNMLGVILGHAELAIGQVDPALPLHADLTEIRKAAIRSADLTRQLLAFARKQTVAPKVLDLNETVGGMLKMLKRLIGEDIDLKWRPEADLWPIKVDPSQIDQILANLCVNARDAISGVGKITIETGNSTFNEDDCAAHAEFIPGEYVLLAVSDDGCGMEKETQAHLFEPFFTTKALGKGTGLGLATVYGIVKQNNGFINVYSEPNQGTTFKIYLPRHEGKAGQAQTEGAARSAQRGQETVLLVEDESSILTLTSKILERQGYTVLAASTPGQAIRMAREYVGRIHLLMTDVVMPEMNGRTLAKNLLSLHPHLKRLFMSGYTADVIAHHGVLDEGVHFLQKPFSIERLAATVRETLDSE